MKIVTSHSFEDKYQKVNPNIAEINKKMRFQMKDNLAGKILQELYNIYENKPTGVL